MNNTITKSAPPKDSVFGSGQYKKHRRRRCRNRNSSLKKKKSKKFYPSKKSTTFKFKPNSKTIMSNWYWENYKKAVEWQNRHKVAYWKSCALALLEENRYLLQIINNMQPGRLPEVTVTQNFGKGGDYCGPYVNKRSENVRSSQHHMGDADEDVDDDDDDDNVNEDNEEADDDFEFEMSEEMMKFFEQSYKHKMDLKKLKEKEMLENTEKEIKKIQTNKVKRSTEMNFLYGDGASMITGMETAVQLSFDKFCDTKSPKYWPNIPLRL